jgi:hypothetical protein
MLAKLVEARIDPGRLVVASEVVGDELIPNFLAHEGAVRGYWMGDLVTGQLLAITMWRDAESLRDAASADGARLAALIGRTGLRLRAVQTLPVLASHVPAGPEREPADARWARVTWVEGVAPEMRIRLPELYQDMVEDQAGTTGFRGSHWIGDELSGEGCALSVWERPADLAHGAGASRRRRRHVARALGCRIGVVRHYRTFGIVSATTPEAAVTDVDAPSSESA